MGSDKSNPLGVGLRTADERQWGTAQLGTCLRVARLFRLLERAIYAGRSRRAFGSDIPSGRRRAREAPAPTIGDRGFLLVLPLPLDPSRSPTATIY